MRELLACVAFSSSIAIASWGKASMPQGAVPEPAPSTAVPEPVDRMSQPGLFWVDVGQGSALLFSDGAGALLAVDAGPVAGADAWFAALERLGMRHIRLWVPTHYDADHLGGWAAILRGPDGRADSGDEPSVASVWDRGLASVPATETAAGYVAWAEAFGPRREVTLGAHAWVGDWSVEVVGRGSSAASAENERGLALCIEGAETRVFVAGDLPAELAMDAARRCGPVDLWVVNHHGALDGVSPALVDMLDPELALVSAGLENAYCHPHAAALELLSGRRVWISGGVGRSPRGSCSLPRRVDPEHRIGVGGGWIPFPLGRTPRWARAPVASEG